MPLPSMRLIAKQCGFSKTTVSLALRNDPTIPPATCVRIQAVADEMGYRLNPLVSALMTQQRSGQSAKTSPLVVFIDYYGALAAPGSNGAGGAIAKEAAAHLLRSFELMRTAAHHLGYQLDYLKARDPGMSPARLQEIVRNRGARGIISLRGVRSPPVWNADWSGYCVVELGANTAGFHQVKGDKLATCRLLLQELGKLGYRRPGLATYADNDLPGSFMRLAFGEYYDDQPRLRKEARYLTQEWSKAGFLTWWRALRPDVVVSTDLAPLEWLRDEGVNVPEQVGFASTDLLPSHKLHAAGMDSREDIRIRAAVEILDGLLRHNERSRPPVPLLTTVVGEWCVGPSVQVQDRASRAPSRAR